MTSAEARLTELGILLPTPPAPRGAYVTWIRTGNLLITSGQLPWQGEVMQFPGRLGAEVTTEQGYTACRLAAINALAQLRAAAGGSLDHIARLVRLEGNVHCAPGFRDHPRVLDGASEFFAQVFGERGLHTRTAVGIPDMPLNACVQISVWAEAVG
ncbi:MAG: RidA family protein [Acidobacteria bacterium]|nr:RidA family protein [Acidobacteriota bacterium]